jgi:hypothetical protein
MERLAWAWNLPYLRRVAESECLFEDWREVVLEWWHILVNVILSTLDILLNVPPTASVWAHRGARESSQPAGLHRILERETPAESNSE